MYKLLRNPFYIYVFGFLITFFIYSLGWSEIYPELTSEIKVFFIITFITFTFFGILVGKLKLIRKTPSLTSIKLISRCFYLTLIFYLIEFIYERDVPLFALLSNRDGVDYREFGIPLLHGVLISFHSFLIAHTFVTYLSTKKRKLLAYNILLYLPALLIVNRSIIVLGILTSFFIYLHFVRKVKIKTQIKIIILAIICLFLFGVIGNLRSGGYYFYDQSKATKEFIASPIPKEYYWTYIYVASPLANFQNTVNKAKVKEYDFKGFIFYENLPKIISNSLGETLEIKRREMVRIVPWLTVGTTYGRSYSYLGWLGPYLLFLLNLLIYILMLFLVPRNSSYHLTTISILSVIVFLNIFTNVLIVTGISFQLAYCIIFAFFERKKFVVKS